jgi:hypothetical protein
MSNTKKPNARQAEANGDQAIVEFRGHRFAISRNYDEWTVDLLESIEEGKSVGIVRGALGPAQWPAVKAMNLRVGDLNDLADKIAKALGFGSTGESAPSSD